MEHKMRRFRQLLNEDVTKKILMEATNGVLSLVDTDGSPYGVPMSFVYDGDNRIYLHSAVDGHKIDCLGHDRRCSFCVVEKDQIVLEEFTTYFRSVIVTGEITVLDDCKEIIDSLKLLCDKYSPGIDCQEEIDQRVNNMKALRIDITSMTGKEAIELVNMR